MMIIEEKRMNLYEKKERWSRGSNLCIFFYSRHHNNYFTIVMFIYTNYETLYIYKDLK